LTRLDNKALDAIIVVMQRLHLDDLVGYLLEQGGWTHLNLPAIAEIQERIQLGAGRFHIRKSGDLLHPEREPQAVLDQIKRTMGSIEFTAQYQQAPVPPGGNLIKWSWFQFYEEEPTCLPNDRIIVSWDTAMSSGELSGYSVCIILLARGDTTYVLDVLRDRLEYPALKRKAIEIHQRWRRATRNYALLIENKGSGMSLIQDLRQHSVNAIPIVPDGDKIMRMNRQPRASRPAVCCYQRMLHGWTTSAARSWPFLLAGTTTRSTLYRRRSIGRSITEDGVHALPATDLACSSRPVTKRIWFRL